MLALTLVVLVFALVLVAPPRWRAEVRRVAQPVRVPTRLRERVESVFSRGEREEDPGDRGDASADAGAAPGETEPGARGSELPSQSSARPTFGQSYTRAEIHAMFGGGTQASFPHVNGRVVCGCFHPGLHPFAPYVVLPGFGAGVRRWAAALAEQEGAIPCFLRRETGGWEYVGEFGVVAVSSDPGEVAEWEGIAGREGDVSMVLYLEEERAGQAGQA